MSERAEKLWEKICDDDLLTVDGIKLIEQALREAEIEGMENSIRIITKWGSTLELNDRAACLGAAVAIKREAEAIRARGEK